MIKIESKILFLLEQTIEIFGFCFQIVTLSKQKMQKTTELFASNFYSIFTSNAVYNNRPTACVFTLSFVSQLWIFHHWKNAAGLIGAVLWPIVNKSATSKHKQTKTPTHFDTTIAPYRNNQFLQLLFSRFEKSNMQEINKHRLMTCLEIINAGSSGM